MQARKKREPTASGQKRPSTASGKLPVAAPTSVKSFGFILLMHITRKTLFVETSVKLGIYLGAVTIGSVVTDLFPFPRSYFSEKSNFFNTYLVKLGWGWTFSLLFTFIYLTSVTYCCGNVKMAFRQHLSRLAVGTAWWYICVNIFNYIENATGFCSTDNAAHFTKKLCKDDNGTWIGFDISGHTFLLMHCLLTISEEVKCVNGWERIADIIKEEEENPVDRIPPEHLIIVKELYDKNLLFIRLLMIAIALLQIVWEVMLLTTIIYFHNMPQKLLAATFASVGWLIFYQVWYKSDLLPRQPGKGLFPYIKPS